jgi:hypothetical protein
VVQTCTKIDSKTEVDLLSTPLSTDECIHSPHGRSDRCAWGLAVDRSRDQDECHGVRLRRRGRPEAGSRQDRLKSMIRYGMYLTHEGQLQVTSEIVQLSDRLPIVTIITIGDLDAALGPRWGMRGTAQQWYVGETVARPGNASRMRGSS